MNKYYYQQINDIGKEVALVASSSEIKDANYRQVDKEYYDEVLKLLKEMAEDMADEVAYDITEDEEEIEE